MYHRSARALLMLLVWATLGVACAEDPSPLVEAASVEAARGDQAQRLLEVPEGVDLVDPRYRALFRPGAELELRLSEAGESEGRWRWTLTRVGRSGGGALGVSLDAAPVRVDERTVAYARGPIEEQYLDLGSAIEQRFVIAEALELGGEDLVIEGAVRCEGRFSSRRSRGVRGAWLLGGRRVTLGEVFVRDADGRAIPATLEARADATRLVVDGAALAEARYPVVIDPEIGVNDLRVSDVGAAGDATTVADSSAMAFRSATPRFLVVWSADDSGTDNESEIYGQLLDTTGAEVGVNDFRVSFQGPDGDAAFDGNGPAVAYNSTDDQFLVVWQGDQSPGVDEIYGQLLSGDGAPIGGNFRVSDMGLDDLDGNFDAQAPRVTYNAADNEYFVVWEGDDLVNGDFDVYGQRVSAAGAEVGANDILITSLGVDNDAPDVVWNSTRNEYLVIAKVDVVSTQDEVYAQRVSNLGALLGAPIQASAITAINSVFDIQFPAVTYNPDDDEYLIAYQGDNTSSGDEEIWAQRVDGAGALIGGRVQISTSGAPGVTTFDAERPRPVYNAVLRRYAVAFNRDTTVAGEDEIYIQELSAAGALIGVNERLSDMGPDASIAFRAVGPSAAADAAGNLLVAWDGDDDAGGLVDNEFEIFAQRYGPAPAADGQACGAGPQCLSGNCVDGVCCDTACGGGAAGDCQACLGSLTGGADGSCAPIRAGVECRASLGVCDVAEACDGSSVACPADVTSPAGTPCGDGTDDACTDPDSCDGSGSCQSNHAPPGASCGDTGVLCLNDDSCDGAGGCRDNGFAVAGTACGDGTDDACTDPDSCDGAGSCQPNHAPAGASCGDTGVPCLNDDRCDGAGGCADNGLAPDGSACDDGLFCTDGDACAAGACEAGAEDPCMAGQTCDEASASCTDLPDGGVETDAGMGRDAGPDAGTDAGTDAGAETDAGGEADAGGGADAGGMGVSGGACACRIAVGRAAVGRGAGREGHAPLPLLGGLLLLSAIALRRRRR